MPETKELNGQRIKFTVDRLRSLQPDPGRQTTTVWDDASPRGALFGMRISAKGKKAFFIQFRSKSALHGKVVEHKEAVASFDELEASGNNLRSIRDRAEAMLAETKHTGLTLVQRERAAAEAAQAAAEEAAREAREEAARTITLAQFFDDTYLLEKRNKRSLARDVQIFNTYIRPEFGDVAMRDIERKDVLKLHAKIGDDDGKPFAANRVAQLIGSLFIMGIDNEVVERNPARLKKDQRNKEAPRGRYLDFEHELPFFLAALKEVSAEAEAQRRTACDVLWMLLLTGARVREVIEMPWSELDLDERLWHKPASRTKQKRDHTVPLSNGAMSILLVARGAQRNEPAVFKVSYHTVREVFIVVKKRAREIVIAHAEREGREPRGKLFEDLRIHDLRRSVATYLANVKRIPEGFIDELLGHSTSNGNRVTATYVRTDLGSLWECVEALESML